MMRAMMVKTALLDPVALLEPAVVADLADPVDADVVIAAIGLGVVDVDVDIKDAVKCLHPLTAGSVATMCCNPGEWGDTSY
jgi:hypothetical protein